MALDDDFDREVDHQHLVTPVSSFLHEIVLNENPKDDNLNVVDHPQTCNLQDEQKIEEEAN